MPIAPRLKELRLRKGQSLQEVANAIGASKAHIWELETGKSTNPSLDLLRRLAEHFDITVAKLIGETIIDVPESIIRMHRNLKGLNERDQALIDDIIGNMKKRQKQRGTDET